MDQVISDVINQFSKPELLQVAKDAKLKVDEAQSVKKLVGIIIEHMKKIVASDDDIELSDLAFEFCITAELVDEEGNPLSQAEKRPECFGYRDDRDPACVKCPHKDACLVRWKSIIPECYGKRWNKSPEECKECINFQSCKQEMESR